MKKIKQIINRYFISDEQPFETRILNFVCLLGAVSSGLALISRFVAGLPFVTVIPLVLMIAAILSILLMSVKKAKYASALTTLIVLGVSVVFWPFLFFTIGGPVSGMAVYFALALILDFTLLKSKTRVFAVMVTSAVTIFCYASTLFFGWGMLPGGGLDSAYQLFIDMIQSIFIVGFYMSSIILFQTGLFRREEKKAAERFVQQQLMSSISKSFISKEPMDDLINKALARMGEFLKVSRVLIILFEKNSERSHPEYIWFSNPENRPDKGKEGLSRIVKGLFSLHPSEEEEVPIIRCDNTLAHENKKFKIIHDNANLMSFLWAPLYVENELWGILSIEECQNTRQWSDSDTQLVGSVSSAIASAVSRDIMDKERIAALEQALTASRAKGDFLSNMSHEMRTPMNAIIGMTAIGQSSLTVDKKDEAFDKIDEASKHLLGVINDVLDMSKIEANKLELSAAEFNLEKMLQKVVDVVNFRIGERRQHFYINIDKNVPRMLIGDDQRLSQVITNLLSNAIKFTPEEGTVRLDTELVTEQGGMCTLQISVTDTGIGITDEQKQRLFQSFEQAESGTSRKYGGTGLGLVISKRIVELMGGNIWVESEIGRGSKFIFTVLLRRSSENHPHLLSEGVDWSNIRIFVVDDEPEILKFFAEVSADLDISCAVSASGEEAAGLLSLDDGYDIYFLDWKLPGMDGIELARQIRAKTARKSIVILFSSADWSDIENDSGSEIVDKFLQKPLFRSNIVDIINECLGISSAAKRRQNEGYDDFSGHTILLVEDIDINREVVLALLGPTNLAVDCAENGRQALDIFEAAPDKYDMIFMDVHMPEMDGYEATRSIRALDLLRAREIPIVAMTANVFREDVEKCLAAGMNAHVGKPLNLDDVLANLKKYLK
ncbi:MAG: response regulator [Oscillospiraceae bacterium]|nr:response regulator [Oscillospiraceae bacterium]